MNLHLISFQLGSINESVEMKKQKVQGEKQAQLFRFFSKVQLSKRTLKKKNVEHLQG